MSTLSPVVQIQLERPLPPEAFLDRVYDELHRAEKELNKMVIPRLCRGTRRV
jgi:hypothetical protein